MSSVQVAVAPNFHLPGTLSERLSVGGVDGWRTPAEQERSMLTPAQVDEQVLLFALPHHLQTTFWTMLELPEADRDFFAVVTEIGSFLTFKQLPPPEHALFELVLHGTSGTIDPRGLWALINMGDTVAVVIEDSVRVCLSSGEGARLPEGIACALVPPEDESIAVLLLIRRPIPQPTISEP